MPSFTKKAIKESFLKLLNKRPLNQITVKDIVEDCGINRNSFYYHFQDIPTLLTDIIREDADRIISEHATNSMEECMGAAVSFALQNKTAVLHIHNSVSRDIYEKYLNDICQYSIEEYVDKAVPKEGVKLREGDRELLISFYKCELFGQIIEWTNSGMNYDLMANLKRLLELFEGSTERALRRSGGLE